MSKYKPFLITFVIALLAIAVVSRSSKLASVVTGK